MIDERFAFITTGDGQKFQVLKTDENGNPIDWDEELTKKLIEDSANAA